MAQGSKKRTTGKGKSGTGRTGRVQEVQEIPEFLRGEVLIIVSLAAAVLLFLSNFHLCGVVGDFLRGVQLGLFGAVGYVFPVLLFMGISFYVSNAGSLKAVIKLAGGGRRDFSLLPGIQFKRQRRRADWRMSVVYAAGGCGKYWDLPSADCPFDYLLCGYYRKVGG